MIELVIREDGEDVTDIGTELSVNSLRKKKHQRSPGRESRSSSGDTRQEREERRKSLEIEKRRTSVEIQYGRESLDRECAERDCGQETGENGQKRVKRRERDARESLEKDSQDDFGQKSVKTRDWDSQELAAAVADQAAALAGLEQKMERIIGQVILY